MDAAGFADALGEVIADEALQKILIAAGAERLKNFSWERCAAKTTELLNAVNAS
jgi:glycosyltransferase involved in cell wall biosynthesis